MKVLITGTGLVASHLSEELSRRDIDHAFMSTSKDEFKGKKSYRWNIERREIDPKALDDVTHIVHLAGARIADKRWTRSRKKELMDSRIDSADLLLSTSKENGNKLKAFISASAIGYYGAVTSEHIFTEEDQPGNDFLSEICIEWEKAADQFALLGVRVVKIRTAIVLASEHSALQKLVKPIRNGIGAPLGNGNQYFPWIHIDDLIKVYMEAISDDTFTGVYNACSPNETTNKVLTNLIAKILGKKLISRKIPAAAIKLAFGELSVSLLEGSRVSPTKLLATGFSFEHPDLEESLRGLLI